MGGTITEIEIEIDCIDPVPVSEFWSLVLGWEMHHDGDPCWMSATGEHVPGDLMLVFAPVPESKTVKNRLHFDVSPFGCSPEDEVTRLIGLGARRADVGQCECRWIVLADPEGNEFCLLPTQVG